MPNVPTGGGALTMARQAEDVLRDEVEGELLPRPARGAGPARSGVKDASASSCSRTTAA
jgi:hypothetical protein